MNTQQRNKELEQLRKEVILGEATLAVFGWDTGGKIKKVAQ